MSLDLRKTAPQISAMGDGLRASWQERTQRLDRAAALLRNPLERGLAAKTLVQRVEAAGPPRQRVSFLVAGLPAGESLDFGRGFDAPPSPGDYVAVAADGSQIALDHHGPVSCFLLNTSTVAIRYGEERGASIVSEPRLFSGPEELAFRDPDGAVREQAIDEVLMGTMRAVLEIEALAEALERNRGEGPVVVLLDGSLVRWELSSTRYPDFVKQRLLQEGYLAALDRLREASRRRPLAFAGYISGSRSTEVTNVLRVAWCPHDGVETRGCDNICGKGGMGRRECGEVADGVLDRALFGRVLAAGQRSDLFASQSPIVRAEYGPHEVRFCYVNVGDEVVRVEMPEWVAQDTSRLELLHSLVLDQCRKGDGYPVALREAHEAAVVSESDRRVFWQLVGDTLTAQGLSAASSSCRAARARLPRFRGHRRGPS
ncbi:MAG: DNA double-strand break repair nuclease NurA [Chloroflexi bacterium]|nr:DNA double-strand break repair nuclease NurA [Chloroflexota bacterium]